jgi:hypothetical protein
MCLQLVLEVKCKRPKKSEGHLIFITFGIKKFVVKNIQEKKTLMFECYNLLDSIE